MNRFEWRTQYDVEEDEHAGNVSTVYFNDPSKTQQHHRDDADLNVLMKRMGIKDGALLPVASDPRYYGDFTDELDLQSSLLRVKNAQDRFNALPADLRDRFNNDPSKLFRFVTNEANKEEAIKLGLLKRAEKAANPNPPLVQQTPAA